MAAPDSRPQHTTRLALACFLLGGVAYGYWRLFPSPGTDDVRAFWMRWIALMREHGLVAGYRAAQSDYPPLSFILLWLVDRLGTFAGLNPLVALKVGISAFSFASAGVVWRWTRRLDVGVALLGALMLNSVGLAYLDVWYALPLLVSLWAMQRGRLTLSAASLTAAILTKWQPLIAAPFFAIHGLRVSLSDPRFSHEAAGRRLARAVGAMAAGVLPLGLIAVVMFGVEPIGVAFYRAQGHGALSFQGLNLNWIIQLAVHAREGMGGFAYFDVIPPRAAVRLARMLFDGSYLFLLATLWRRGRTFEDFAWYAMAGALAYCVFHLGVHENHFALPMILAFGCLAGGWRHGWAMAIAIAFTANANLFLFYGTNGQPPWPADVFEPLSVIISALNVLLMTAILWAAGAAWRPRRDALSGSPGPTAT